MYGTDMRHPRNIQEPGWVSMQFDTGFTQILPTLALTQAAPDSALLTPHFP